MISINYFLILSALLFGIGLYGIMSRKNAIIILISIEIMINAAMLNFVVFSSYNNSISGQIFTLILIAFAAAEVAVGLGILLAVYRLNHHIELDKITILRW